MLIQQLKRLLRWWNPRQTVTYKDDPVLSDALEDPYATIVIQLREDGDFAVSMDFTRTSATAADVTATMLHMIHSGIMIEYFIEALKLWAEDEEGQKFAFQIIKDWKAMHDKENNFPEKQHQLAIDPSEVFGLKHLKAQ